MWRGGDGGTRKKGNWLLTESHFTSLEWSLSYKFLKGGRWTRQALKIHFIFISCSWYVRWDYNPKQWSCFFRQYWWHICTHPSSPLHKSSWAATTLTPCSKPATSSGGVSYIPARFMKKVGEIHKAYVGFAISWIRWGWWGVGWNLAVLGSNTTRSL